MDSYLLLKTVHILSATVLFGTGLGTAFHMWMTHLSGNLDAIVVASRNTVRADWMFTTPAVVIQPLTGILMIREAGFDPWSDWIVVSTGLYLLAGACWLPVVWLQMRMHALAKAAQRAGTDLPPLYHRYVRIWFALGWPAFLGVLVVFHLMVSKAV
ncbi:MAG: DUF2269 domain-containing protein [Rhodospirillaceae bacterium]|nr:DUF2269 domain-containing protein [Rhodospirillaceae bacterium]